MKDEGKGTVQTLWRLFLASVSTKRLGLRELISEHKETLYQIDPETKKRKWDPADVTLFLLLPALVLLTFLIFQVKIRGVAEIVAGMAILTALLFGLLIHVFNVSVTLKERRVYQNSSGISILLRELRKNISYACGIGLLVTTLLVSSAAFTEKLDDGVNFIMSALIASLFVHLIATLLMVLNEVIPATLKWDESGKKNTKGGMATR